MLLKLRKIRDVEAEIKGAKQYDVNFNFGLSSAQVAERTDNELVNKYRKTVTKSYLEIIFKNLFTVLNIILIACAVIFMIFGLWSRLFFVLILTLNIGISLFQDLKARRLVEKLSLISNPRATVVRDGIKKTIPFNELVLSDIIILKAGNTIPCDAVICHGSIHVNESLLSGESDDVFKDIGDLIYAESVVTSGFAYAQVAKIGKANYVSKLQDKARLFSRPKSDILRSLTTIIRTISVFAILVGLLQIISCVINKKPFNGSTIDPIASSIVGMIPSGMYLMTSVTLTVGVIILGKHNMLVRELYSIEMLARVNMVCLDKTGTLTDGNMSVKRLITIDNYPLSKIEEIISELLYATKDENLTAKCLKEKYNVRPIKGDYVAIPFSSDKKCSAYSANGKTYILGAYGFIGLENDNKVKDLVETYENEGRRVLLIAECNKIIEDNKLPEGFNAIALLVLSENIKVDAKENIEWFKSNDVGIRLISGDSVSSLKMIAKEVGIENYSKAISLNNMSDADVIASVKDHVIFARVTPDQKKLIVDELRREKNTVAMVGDGVNDLLALKAADCSIAMASGSDAAKAASHLVSLDSNFSSLPKVVEEGRRVINNLQRVCSIFLVKSAFVIFFSILFFFLSLGFKDLNYPFSTNSLFFWEFLTIGIAPFFIALEPNKDRIKGKFSNNIFKETIPAAIIQIIMTLPIIIIAYAMPDIFNKKGALAMATLAFTIMSFIILLHVCLPLSKYRSRVLMVTSFAMVLAIGLDVLLRLKTNWSILQIDYLSINKPDLLLGILVFIVSIPIYFLIAWLINKWFIKSKKVIDEKGRAN